MYVCLCRAVTERKVRSTIKQGARDCAEVADRCGAGSRCGGCQRVIEEMLQEHCSRVHALRQRPVLGAVRA